MHKPTNHPQHPHNRIIQENKEMEQKISIKEWIAKFNRGEYDLPDVRTQIKAGWWDWFCRDQSLAKKTEKMGNIIRQLKDGGKFSTKENYVWFKNNCPLTAPLYDDFRIASMGDGEVQATIVIGDKRNNHRYTVYGRKTKGGEFNQSPLFETDSQRELISWMNTAW